MAEKKNHQEPELKLERKKKAPSMAMPSPPGSTDVHQDPLNEKPAKKLKLDTKSIKPAKSRKELYDELLKDEVGEERDFYSCSPVSDRVFALVIDAAFMYGLYNLILFLEPLQFQNIQAFLDLYGLQFSLGNEVLSNLIMFGTGLFLLFFFVVLPVAFFNCSLGKLIFGIRVRGDGRFGVTITDAFLRELIIKPVGIACLVGFIMPFTNEQKKSLHDKVVGTFVVKATSLFNN